MIALIAGLLIWTVLHILPASAPGLRGQMIARLGDGPYKGVFSVFIAASILLMVLGYRAMPAQTALYDPPQALHPLTYLLVALAYILFAASGMKSNIARLIRHPQLTGFALWAGVHFLISGSVRGVLLFGGLALWAIAEIQLINRRDGAWQRPNRQPVRHDVLSVLIGLVIMAAVISVHYYLSGRSLLAGLDLHFE